jgi:hypothetical protein
MIIALRQNRWSSLPAATRILGWMLRRGRKKLFIVKHHHPSSHRVARVSVFGVSFFPFLFPLWKGVLSLSLSSTQ